MPTNERKPEPSTPREKLDDKITDLPERDQSTKDQQVKGGAARPPVLE